MRYNDNRLFPRFRDRMRDWIKPEHQKHVSHKDDAEDDSELAWRQYIL